MRCSKLILQYKFVCSLHGIGDLLVLIVNALGMSGADLVESMLVKVEGMDEEHKKPMVSLSATMSSGGLGDVSMVARLVQPPRFSGAGTKEQASSWLRVVDSYLKRLSKRVVGWDSEVELDVVIGLLDGDAHTLAERMRDDLGEAATWAKVRKALEERFGTQLDTLTLIYALKTVRQGARSVGEYTTDFENRLDYVIRVGMADSVSAATYFVEGLNDGIRRTVLQALMVRSVDPFLEYVSMTPGAAVRAISHLAIRSEEFETKFMGMKPTTAARAAVAVSIGHRQESRDDRRERFVHALAQRYGLTESVVRQRMEASVCVSCGKPGHVANKCRNGAAVRMVASAGPARASWDGAQASPEVASVGSSGHQSN